ncbi:hypothetical protein KKH82_02365 [Patescibacteria group bacterium]|nr:hypothetical protein [Patescibacteria group bacterium]
MTTKDTLEILKVLPNEHDVLEILTDMKKNDLRKLLKLNQKQREEWEEELRVIKTQIGMVEKEYLTIAEEAELVDILQKELAKTITPQETKSLVREFE